MAVGTGKTRQRPVRRIVCTDAGTGDRVQFDGYLGHPVNVPLEVLGNFFEVLLGGDPQRLAEVGLLHGVEGRYQEIVTLHWDLGGSSDAKPVAGDVHLQILGCSELV